MLNLAIAIAIVAALYAAYRYLSAPTRTETPSATDAPPQSTAPPIDSGLAFLDIDREHFAKCAVGDLFKLWTHPDRDEIRVYCQGSIGDLGKVATMLRADNPTITESLDAGREVWLEISEIGAGKINLIAHAGDRGDYGKASLARRKRNRATTETVKISAATNARQLAKAAQSLIGICSGILADNQLDDREIQFLSTWLTEHPDVVEHWPGSEIARRVRDALVDGIVTDEERADLMSTLQQITGNFFGETGAAIEEGPALPIDPHPVISFNNTTFCFTGNFLYGTRAACQRAIEKVGGKPVDSVTKKLNYLVIGTMIEPTWVNTTFGRKIEKASDYRDSGVNIVIISERQWTAALDAIP